MGINKSEKVYLPEKMNYIELIDALEAIEEVLSHRREMFPYMHSYYMTETYRRQIASLEKMKRNLCLALEMYDNKSVKRS